MMLLLIVQAIAFAGPSAGSYATHDEMQLQGSPRYDSDVNLKSAKDLNVHSEQAVMSNSSTYLNNFYNWAHSQYGPDSMGSRLPKEH